MLAEGYDASSCRMPTCHALDMRCCSAEAKRTERIPWRTLSAVLLLFFGTNSGKDTKTQPRTRDNSSCGKAVVRCAHNSGLPCPRQAMIRPTVRGAPTLIFLALIRPLCTQCRRQRGGAVSPALRLARSIAPPRCLHGRGAHGAHAPRTSTSWRCRPDTLNCKYCTFNAASSHRVVKLQHPPSHVPAKRAASLPLAIMLQK